MPANSKLICSYVSDGNFSAVEREGDGPSGADRSASGEDSSFNDKSEESGFIDESDLNSEDTEPEHEDSGSGEDSDFSPAEAAPDDSEESGSGDDSDFNPLVIELGDTEELGSGNNRNLNHKGEKPGDAKESEPKAPETESLTLLGRGQGRKNFCLYFEKGYFKIARHLEDMHSSEIDVARALAAPKGRCRQTLAQLRNKGNLNHNFECRGKGKGILVPKYRPRNGVEKNYQNYSTCTKCLGMYGRCLLWKHRKNCPGVEGDTSADSKHSALAAGDFLNPVHGGNERLKKNHLGEHYR